MRHMARVSGSSARKLTYQDFVKFPDDGNRHELIDGVHYVSPSPNLRHQRIAGYLFVQLWNHLEQHGGGEVFISPLDVVFTLFDVVEPDVVYVSEAKKRALTEKNIQGAPDVVVEVISPGTRSRDERTKLALYDRADVIEYWLVDPAANTVKVYRRVDGHLIVAAELSRDAGDHLTSPFFAGLSLPLTRVFAS